MKKKVNQLFLLLIFIAGNAVVYAQSTYQVTASKENNMKLSGTSTLHKWEMNSKTFSGAAEFGVNPSNVNELKTISALSFSLPVTALKSDEKKLDRNAYKALKTGSFKNITYKLLAATVLPGTLNRYLVKTRGNLTIAGVTKEITMDVYCVVNKDASITCTGSDKLNMTDYNVKPPSFMLGAMKTGNAVTLDFSLAYKK